MGPEHLSRGAVALGVALVACGGEAAPAPVVPREPSTHHAQIIRALTTPERSQIVARFRERNGATWEINEAALVTSTTVVDPFVGFLRRARTAAPRAPVAAPVSEADAVLAARAFVKKNADLLGLPHQVVPTLGDHARAVAPEDHAPARAVWAVRLETTFPSKRYEAFAEMENKADIEVIVDDDGAPSVLNNLSQIHPRLAIDTKPLFGPDDDRMYAKLIGRRVFALAEGEVQVPLGLVAREDFQASQLGILASRGPMAAWLTYRLVWGVRAVKSSSAGDLTAYAFTWIVDADTGEVLVDATPPVTPEVEPGP